MLCNHCGKTNHSTGDCKIKSHPDANPNPHTPFLESEKGKIYKEKGKSWIRKDKKLDAGRDDFVDHESNNHRPDGKKHQSPKGQNPKKRDRSGMYTTCTECLDYINNINNTLYSKTKSNSIVHADVIIGSNHIKTNECLLDNGALQGNYVREDMASELIALGAQSFPVNKRVCSCFNECRKSSTAVNCDIEFVCKLTNEKIKVNLDLTVVDELPFKIIVGEKDIEKFNLKNISNDTQNDQTLRNLETGTIRSGASGLASCASESEGSGTESAYSRIRVEDRTMETASCTLTVAATAGTSGSHARGNGPTKPEVVVSTPTHVKHMSEYIDGEVENDGIPWK